MTDSIETLKPAQIDDRKAIQIWDALYSPDDEAIWGDDPAAYVVEEVAAMWRIASAERILIIPSGDGRNIHPLIAEFQGIVAADTSASALEVLKQNCARDGLPYPETHVTNVYEPQFEHKSFDAVLCWDLLSHLDAPLKAIAALNKLLKPVGGMVVNFFSDEDPSIRCDTMCEPHPNVLINEQGICYRLYSEADVHKMARELGLSGYTVETIEWWEGSHPGYREYDHMHRGHVLRWSK